ncbi:MAG: ATP-dependent DNA helicase RecG [Pseudomonadales bacterium]|nr:ATP-dependent DNA helicase RecG [Candidatus Woesebacteria bacterium]MCB9801175.1 ATP-dependent DNA helicase RecG [Pseudomonadales bacterium]
MYFLSTRLDEVKGIGDALYAKLEKRGYSTVKDLVLAVPLRYEDRSHTTQIAELQSGNLITVRGKMSSARNFYKGRRSMQSAKVSDETGTVKLQWFNNPHVISNIKDGEEYYVSGTYNPKYKSIAQPTIERVFDSHGDAKENIHTGRLVPLYSTMIPLKQGTQRRVLKEILNNLRIPNDLELQHMRLVESFDEIHFPTTVDHVVLARERLALEELLALIRRSRAIKQEWKELHTAPAFEIPAKPTAAIPASIPFSLTNAQQKSVTEILKDISQSEPMNRLLIGDVGSGKTVVAGIACNLIAEQNKNSAIIAPTKILATQHAESLVKLFPDLNVELVTGGRKPLEVPKEPTLFVGTHAVINRLENIKPALVIYDEQHRFGVGQRSAALGLSYMPHILTMSATPIPRSLMLTIFSHLQLSVIDEMPAGRLPTKTWLVPDSKREDSYNWMAKNLTKNHAQAIVVCPFIDPSEHLAFENVVSATETFEAMSAFMRQQHPGLRLGLLHGRQKKTEQSSVIKDLYAGEIDILVTTPMVEVGLDLKRASIIVIEAAERFGMASLHQLRGRVGRANQQGYCLLFSNANGMSSKERLEAFSKENNGLKLAELDLKNRGSGNLFGTMQHGFSDLQFADWANLELIGRAQKTYEELPNDWEPLFATDRKTTTEIPLAN